MLHFLEKAFVGRVMRRIPFLMLRFCGSICDVQMRLLSGFQCTDSPLKTGPSGSAMLRRVAELIVFSNFGPSGVILSP